MKEVKVEENSAGTIDHCQGERERSQKMSVDFVTRLDIGGFSVRPTKRSSGMRIKELMWLAMNLC